MQLPADAVRGHVVVVMAPTGSGKTTLVKHVDRLFPELYLTVSCTTRTPRPGEVDGREYYFLTPEAFAEKVENDDFLEWAEYGGHRYGTLKSEVLPRLTVPQVVITEIELQGMLQLKDLVPPGHFSVVYIDAGDWPVLEARITARAPMSHEEIARRHTRFLVEQEAKHHATFVIDNTANDGQMVAAKKQFETIITTLITNVTSSS